LLLYNLADNDIIFSMIENIRPSLQTVFNNLGSDKKSPDKIECSVFLTKDDHSLSLVHQAKDGRVVLGPEISQALSIFTIDGQKRSNIFLFPSESLNTRKYAPVVILNNLQLDPEGKIIFSSFWPNINGRISLDETKETKELFIRLEPNSLIPRRIKSTLPQDYSKNPDSYSLLNSYLKKVLHPAQ
jgi:hypothetical protein